MLRRLTFRTISNRSTIELGVTVTWVASVPRNLRRLQGDTDLSTKSWEVQLAHRHGRRQKGSYANPGRAIAGVAGVSTFIYVSPSSNSAFAEYAITHKRLVGMVWGKPRST